MQRLCRDFSGNLRRRGLKARINLSLAETKEGKIVWNERVERPFETLLDTVDDIAAHIA
jgi:adenylate cyclase